jgi:hypothetical protein
MEVRYCPYDDTKAQEILMRKLLQNTLFAAMTAWALHGMQTHLEATPAYQASASTMAYWHH